MKVFKKSVLFCLFFVINRTEAQSRFAIAPVVGFIQGNITSRNSFLNPASHDRGYGPLVGILGYYSFTSKWSVSTGVNYHQIHLKPNEKIEKRGYWNVPILLNYKAIHHTFAPYFSVGTIIASPSTYRPNPSTSLDIILGTGLLYKPNSRVSWIIQPQYQKEVMPRPSNFIPTNYQSYKISVQLQALFQL